MRALFIYWKVSPERLPQALAAGHAFQAECRRRHPALTAALYQRATGTGTDSADGPVTVMETYTQPGGLDAPTQQVLIDGGQATLATWCTGLRHIEHFNMLPP